MSHSHCHNYLCTLVSGCVCRCTQCAPVEQPKVCPNCGYCSHCGRKNVDFQPYIPYQPIQPYIVPQWPTNPWPINPDPTYPWINIGPSWATSSSGSNCNGYTINVNLDEVNSWSH